MSLLLLTCCYFNRYSDSKKMLFFTLEPLTREKLGRNLVKAGFRLTLDASWSVCLVTSVFSLVQTALVSFSIFVIISISIVLELLPCFRHSY